MVNENCDILVDIPDEDLPKLAEMYKQHENLLPEVYGIITTGIEWRKKRKEKYLRFMSPNGSWKQDGTFFVLLAHYSFDIFIFSLDDSGKNIYEGVKNTKRLNPGDYKDRLPLLHTTHSKVYPSIIEGFKDQGRIVSSELVSYRFSVPKEEALKFEMNCPSEVYIKKLDSSDAEVVNQVWPHHYKDSVKYVSLLIEMNDTYGVFLKSTDELAACSLVSMLGQLGIVQTVGTHKKKGYASLIVKHVAKEIAQKGHNPFLTVLVDNVAAISLFEKVGFKNLGVAYFTQVK